LWQPGSYDHGLRKVDDFREIAEYTLENPVRKGLADTPDEWRWSDMMEPVCSRTAFFVAVPPCGALLMPRISVSITEPEFCSFIRNIVRISNFCAPKSPHKGAGLLLTLGGGKSEQIKKKARTKKLFFSRAILRLAFFYRIADIT